MKTTKTKIIANEIPIEGSYPINYTSVAYLLEWAAEELRRNKEDVVKLPRFGHREHFFDPYNLLGIIMEVVEDNEKGK